MRHCIAALLLSLVLHQVHGLYEDQAGTFDWHRQQVGAVQHATLHKTKPRAYVATKQNVIAALQLRDGGIAWRRVLNDNDKLDAVVAVEKPASVLSLSSNGRLLRSWDQVDGALQWEVATYSAQTTSQAQAAGSMFLVNEGRGQSIAVFSNHQLQLYDTTDGTLIWGVSIPSIQPTHLHLVNSESDRTITLWAVKPGSGTITVVTLSSATGAISTTGALASDLPLSSTACTSGPFLAAVSQDRSSVCIASATSVTCTPVSLHPNLSPTAPLRLLPTPTGLSLSSSSPSTPGVSLLSLSPAGELQIIKHYPDAQIASQSTQFQSKDAVALLTIPSSGPTSLLVVDSTTGAALHSESFGAISSLKTSGAAAQPVLAALGTFRRKEAGEGVRVLLSLQDATLSLLQQGEAVWSREEALASVTSTLFQDLPTTRAASPSSVAGSASDHLRMQLLALKTQLQLHTPEEAAELATLRTQLSSRLRPTRDANGLRKLVVMLSAEGKLLAQHTGGGDPMWGRRWAQGQEPDRLLPWKTFHDVAHAPQVLVLRSSFPPSASVINAHTGEEVDSLSLPSPIHKLLPLSSHMHDGAAEQAIYLAIPPAGGAPFLIPDTPATTAHLRRLAPSMYYWLLDAPTNTLTGFSIMERQEGGWASKQLWRLALPRPVLAVASRDVSEPVHTLTKVLGDRSFLIKYVNPNTIFVATGPSSDNAPTSDPLPIYLTAHIIDTVSGKVLYRQAHPGARGPVQAVFSENWVVYQYFSTLSNRLEISVMELYDSTPRTFSPLDLFSGNVGDFTQTSREIPPLQVLTQTFFSRTPLKALAVTRTFRGITSKELLMATSTDQVYRMDRRFLDPRRPLRNPPRQTKEDQEEGLIPYMDTLVMMPNSYATYDKQVAGLRSVFAAPASLESTSHMLAVGVDLMYTRLQPSGGFDTLPDDFSYALLVLALGALCVGAVVMNLMGKRAELRKKWQ